MFQDKISQRIFILKCIPIQKRIGGVLYFDVVINFTVCWTWKCNYTKAVVWLFPCCFSQWQYNSCGRVSQQEDLSSLDFKTQQESQGSPERSHQPADSKHTDWITIYYTTLPKNNYTHTTVFIYKEGTCFLMTTIKSMIRNNG